MKPPTVLAITAHPDDIEFHMAGTLLMLQRAGWEIHCFNLASGNGGSTTHDGPTTAAIRREEAQEAARILGAHWHPPIAEDLLVFYNEELLRRVAAVVRAVQPTIVLTHPLEDYMEDHTNTARLAVTATFAHGVPNFQTIPPQPAYFHDVTLYHCMPHSGHDPLRRFVIPGAWVNTTPVNDICLRALGAHQSQQAWLSSSQGMNSFLATHQKRARHMGLLSGKFEYAEGWWRHLHLGFSAVDTDPLQQTLDVDYLANPGFEASVRDPVLPVS